MKKLLTGALFALVAAASGFAQTNGDDPKLVEKAAKIHKDVITLDTHNDINTSNFTETVNYTQDLNTQVNIPKMRKGGLDVSWMIVYTGQGPLTDEGYAAAYKNAIDKFDAIHRLAEKIAPKEIESRLRRKMSDA